MHCSLLLSACGKSAAAEMAWSNSPIDAYSCITSFNVIELEGDDRRLLYIAIARSFCLASMRAAWFASCSGAAAKDAWQLVHCVNRRAAPTGKTGRKNNVN